MPTNPFETIEPHSVGLLIKAVVDAARSADRHIPVGVCGEAAVDPASMDFLTRAGVDYVSCAAPSIPLAWLLSARASVTSAIRPSVIDHSIA
jgi:pyruvate,orthophosphate dikinase